MIRDKCACGKWEEFNRLLGLTDPGNSGNIGTIDIHTCTYHLHLYTHACLVSFLINVQ